MEERRELPSTSIAAKVKKEVLLLHYSVKPRILPGSDDELLEINVPGDGHCLFYSVTLGFLLPVIKNKEAFVERFHLLFGYEEQITTPDKLWELLQKYDGNPKFIQDNEIKLNLLASTPLRARVVGYMQENKFDLAPFLVHVRVQAKLDAANEANDKALAKALDEGIEQAWLESEEETSEEENKGKKEDEINNYYDDMKNTKMWGGQPELINLSRMLKANIIVLTENNKGDLMTHSHQQYGNEYSQNNKIYLVHADNGTHYRYLAKPESFHPEIEAPYKNEYIAQYEKQQFVRKVLIAATVIASFFLPIISLTFIIPLWLWAKGNEVIKKLVTTDVEIEQVKQKKDNWKQCNAQPIKELPLPTANQQSPQKRELLVDKEKYCRFKLFSKNEQLYLNMRVSPDDLKASKEKSVKIIEEYIKPLCPR